MIWVLIGSAAAFFLFRLSSQAWRNHRSGSSWLRGLFDSNATFWVYAVLETLVVLTLVRSIYLESYEHAALCLLSLLLFMGPVLLPRWLHIKLPAALEIILLCFIYSAEILGEINSYYQRIPGWDTMLHTINGFLCAAIGFSLVDMMNRNEHFSVSLSPGYQALMAFCFSMTIGVLWEFVEFAFDQLALLDMQKDFIVPAFSSVSLDKTASNMAIPVMDIARTIIERTDGSRVIIDGGYLDLGIIDTMKDLFVNFIGAVVFSVVGFLYVKHRGHRGNWASQFIPIVVDNPPPQLSSNDSIT